MALIEIDGSPIKNGGSFHGKALVITRWIPSNHHGFQWIPSASGRRGRFCGSEASTSVGHRLGECEGDSNTLPSGNLTQLLKMAIYSGFSH